MSFEPCNETDHGTWLCTRIKDHEGDHVAAGEDPRNVYSVWPHGVSS